MGTMPFDLDAFIAGINNDKSKSSDAKDRLNKVVMNTRDNQGILTMIPIMSRTTGNFYMKIPRVYEYWGDTSMVGDGEAWYRILPIEMYKDLSAEQMALYTEVKGMLDYLNDNEEVSYDEFRVRNYVLLYGICQSLKNTEGKLNDKIKDAPCIFTYPSNCVIDALGSAINTKIEAMKGRREWIPAVLNPSGKGYQGVMMVNFVKSTGPGYDCAISFEFNSAMNTVIDEDYEITDKQFEFFDDVLPQFLGWIYDRSHSSYFNEVAFKELRDQLKIRINKMKLKNENGTDQPADTTQNYDNKNNLGVDATAAPQGIKKTPF